MTKEEIKALPVVVFGSFPQPDDVAKLWGWLIERPEANFDDYGPKTFDDFWEHLREEKAAGVEYFLATVEGLGLVGVYGLKMSNGVCHFHGICFADYVHRTGVATKAIRSTLELVFRERGARKVVAEFFASNARVRSFLDGLGFRSEGFFRNETMQKGCPISVERMALHAGKLQGGK